MIQCFTMAISDPVLLFYNPLVYLTVYYILKSFKLLCTILCHVVTGSVMRYSVQCFEGLVTILDKPDHKNSFHYVSIFANTACENVLVVLRVLCRQFHGQDWSWIIIIASLMLLPNISLKESNCLLLS